MLLSLSFHLLCLPSKEGIIFGLYSYKKSLVIISLILSFLVLLMCKTKIEEKCTNLLSLNGNITIKRYNIHNRNIFIIVLISLTVYLFSLKLSPTIRGDFILQNFANSQYLQGLSEKADRFYFIDEFEDNRASLQMLKWPPGPFYIINLVQFITNLSFSESLRLVGFISCLITSIYLYKIISIFTQNKDSLFTCTLLTSIHPFVTGLSYLNFSNCDIFAISIIVSIIFYIFKQINSFNNSHFENLLHIIITSTILGLTIWFKKSAFVISISIFLFLSIYHFKLFKKNAFIYFFISLICFLIPCFLYFYSMQSNDFSFKFFDNPSTKDNIILESSTNNNYYNELLGEYFSNSTSGIQLLLCILTGPTWYFISNNSFFLFSDLISFTGILNSLSHKFHINESLFFSYVITIPLTTLLLKDFSNTTILRTSSFYFSFLQHVLLCFYLEHLHMIINILISYLIEILGISYQLLLSFNL